MVLLSARLLGREGGRLFSTTTFIPPRLRKQKGPEFLKKLHKGIGQMAHGHGMRNFTHALCRSRVPFALCLYAVVRHHFYPKFTVFYSQIPKFMHLRGAPGLLIVEECDLRNLWKEFFMLEFGACPRCKLDISGERKRLSPVVCNHCGFSSSAKNNVVNIAIEKRTIIIYSSFLALFLGSFIQLTNWDNYALDIIPLKVKETLGMSTVNDLNRTAEICMNLKKWDCVESNYSKVGGQDLTQVPRLGNFQMKRAKFNAAAQTFYGFFQRGGSDLESSYNYAKALAQLGQVDEATKYFEQVLAARPDVLQVTVVQNYVKLLMEHKRYDQARKLIQDIRRRGPETGSFMETEFKKIKDVTTASRE